MADMAESTPLCSGTPVFQSLFRSARWTCDDAPEELVSILHELGV
jgi:hypothetical protein